MKTGDPCGRCLTGTLKHYHEQRMWQCDSCGTVYVTSEREARFWAHDDRLAASLLLDEMGIKHAR